MEGAEAAPPGEAFSLGEAAPVPSGKEAAPSGGAPPPTGGAAPSGQAMEPATLAPQGAVSDVPAGAYRYLHTLVASFLFMTHLICGKAREQLS